jgi:coproporphyrinogen III oxidase-like Fe-S oxidoreductase
LHDGDGFIHSLHNTLTDSFFSTHAYQSFDDRILESLGRVHRTQDVWDSLAMLQDVYGSELSYSMDLISGVPGLSPAQWTETLNTAVHLQPKPSHLSVYDLQIEGGTVFGKWYDSDRESTFHQTRGELPATALALPSEEECAFMYKYAAGYLRSKGYEHYEISSYALRQDSNQPSPTRSKHNQIYWATDSQWYAVGLGATSFAGESLTARPRTMSDYIHWVDQQEAFPELQAAFVEDFDLLTDVVLKRLRTSEGLSLEWVARRFKEGESYVVSILRGAELGLDLGLVTLEDDVLRLVDSAGFIYSNTIISSIFAELGVGEIDTS